MNKFLLSIYFIFFSIILNAQITDEKSLMGEWVVQEVETYKEVENKEAFSFIENGFAGATFRFRGNMIFNWSFDKNADSRFSELFDINDENWAMDEGQIFIGTKANGFSSMHIKIISNNGETFFVLPMIKLKVIQTKNEKAKRPKKSKKKNRNYGREPVEYDEPVYVEIDENDIVPFATVDQVPLGPECKRSWSRDEQKKCTESFVKNHVNRKFNTDLAGDIGLVGRVRIDVKFIIDTDGNPVNISASGGPNVMNENAIDVIASLPKLRSGLQNGEKVNVSYIMPILFMVAN